jgi:exodeoxyribonuclease VII large subunit
MGLGQGFAEPAESACKRVTAEASDTGGLPRYSVAELNQAIGTLLERGFAPRFLLEATASRPQIKKGHLWLTLTDGEASISGVIWAYQLARIDFIPEEGDGVIVVGKLNFWAARANLTVQILDVRPGLSAVMRQFERVRARLAPEGWFEPERKRALPPWPRRIALLTSVPSSALADMLRTARERWPATALLVVPIPVQGAVEARILAALRRLSENSESFGLDAIVLARGGGSREDLAVFDSEDLALALAHAPVPVVCGLGHEDDTTIADLIADYRAATPTAALVALLPDRSAIRHGLLQLRQHLRQRAEMRLMALQQQLKHQQSRLKELHPRRLLARQRQELEQQQRLLAALSPLRPLSRGYCLVHDPAGKLISRVTQLQMGDTVELRFVDGRVLAQTLSLHALPSSE